MIKKNGKNKIMHQPKSKTSLWNLVIFLFVILALVAGGYYFWVTSEKKLEEETEMSEGMVNVSQNINLNINQVSLETYNNNDYNFQVQYPADWKIDETLVGEGDSEIFSVGIGESSSLSVMSDSMEGIVRNSISINSEKEITLNGLKATRLEGGDLKDGSETSMVLVKKEGRLYVLKGYGQEFEQVVDSFSLL